MRFKHVEDVKNRLADTDYNLHDNLYQGSLVLSYPDDNRHFLLVDAKPGKQLDTQSSIDWAVNPI